MSRDVLQAAASAPQRQPPETISYAVPPQPLPAPSAPLMGALEVPEEEDEGPLDGLTMERAVTMLLERNNELSVKRFEISQARADVLTASLRANPMVFGTVTSVPYGNYSPQRPGDTSYGATVIYPFDVGHKRIARTDLASRASRVIEAQFQDAVRLQLDRLSIAYVEVIAARETLRYARANRDGLGQVARVARTLFDNRLIAQTDLERIMVQLEGAELAVEQSEVTLREAKHALGLLLSIDIHESEQIELRGSLPDSAPAPPSGEELQVVARNNRPDLIAYRIGVQRAAADVRLAEAEKTSDVFLLYSPWELRNNAPLGGQNATSWSIAAFASVPLFNRNQGNIQRANLNVAQTQRELVGLERIVAEEVHSAFVEYEASRDAVNRLERSVIPRSRHIRDTVAKLLANGQASTLDYLAAQREHNDIVRQYRDTLIRHRRSMLKINTAVGERILP